VPSGRPPAWLALTALALACPDSAFAFRRDRTPLPTSVSGGSTTSHTSAGGSFARMIVGLAIVIAVIYGVYWLLKAYGRSKGALVDDGRMSIVATTALSPSRSLHLVRIGDELVLVGSADGGITPIRVYAADETRRLALEAGEPEPRGSLLEQLRRRTAR
jgi:flagellar protein FliO/FliZ